MNNEELLKYIKSAIELETDIAIQERTLLECHANIEAKKPVLKLQSLPPKPHLEDTASFVGGIGFLAIGLFITILVIICGAAFLMLISVPLIIAGICAMSSGIKAKNQNNQRIELYNTMLKTTENNNNKIQSDFDRGIKLCNESYNSIYAITKPQIDETQKILDKLYAIGYIYPKYCTLPALTSIYEYFMTGRCSELTGPNGAYNLYEDELRKDTVISQLNTVIENLEQIRHSQFMLYQQVKAIQENTAAITYELQQIKGYTIQIAQLSALNAYYAALNERNTRITMYYHL